MATRLLPSVRHLLTLVPVCLLSLACSRPAPPAQAGLPFPTPQPNLLRNGSFSDGTATWRAGAHDAPLATLGYDQAGFVTAAAAGAGTPAGAAWSQTVAVTPGAAYYASYRVRTEGLAGRADMTISFRDRAGRPLLETGILPAMGDSEWATYAWRCRAPAGAAQATVSLGIEGATAGRAAFDEACLAPDDAPTIRALIVDYAQETGSLRALQGLNGGTQPALAHLHPAHVRVAGLGTLFPNPSAAPYSSASYDWQAADAALAAIATDAPELLLRLDDTTAPAAGAGRWAEVSRHAAMHYNDGWAGGQHYGIRHWEVGAPSQGSPMAYCDRLEATMQALKSHDPALRVGAALPGASSAEPLLRALAERGLRPDFFSCPGDRAGSPLALPTAQAALQQLLAKHGFAGTELELIVLQPSPFAAPWAAAAYGAAHLAATLSYAQDTPATLVYYGNGDAAGLLDSRGGLTAAGEAWHLLHQLADTPQRLLAHGGDLLGFTILAGKSSDGRLAQILIADTGSRSQGYRLALSGWPPGSHYTVTQVAEGQPLAVITTGTADTLQDNVLALSWRSPAVHLIRFQWP